jgi:DNA-binding response OmpR family regulator
VSTTVLLAAAGAAAEPQLEQGLRARGFEIALPGTRADVVIAGDGAQIERHRAEAPVILLGSAGDSTDDRVQAYRRGCADYVPRPFSHDELVERIRAVLRRPRRPEPRRITAGPLEIDEATRVAVVGGIPLKLSEKEFRLLATLASEPHRVFTRGELLRDVWDWPASMRTRTLDSHASRLRRKLRAAAPGTDYIDNEWGVGYRLIGPFPVE